MVLRSFNVFSMHRQVCSADIDVSISADNKLLTIALKKAPMTVVSTLLRHYGMTGKPGCTPALLNEHVAVDVPIATLRRHSSHGGPTKTTKRNGERHRRRVMGPHITG